MSTPPDQFQVTVDLASVDAALDRLRIAALEERVQIETTRVKRVAVALDSFKVATRAFLKGKGLDDAQTAKFMAAVEEMAAVLTKARLRK